MRPRKFLFRIAIFVLTVPGLAGCTNERDFPTLVAGIAFSPIFISAMLICGKQGCGGSTHPARKIPAANQIPPPGEQPMQDGKEQPPTQKNEPDED